MLEDFYADYDDLGDVPEFSEDEFWTDFGSAKEYIKECLNVEKDISFYIKTQLHPYTLWTYLHLNPNKRLPVAEFAPKYLLFLVDVTSHNRGQAQPDPAAIPELQAYQAAVVHYAANAKGASTDLAQRNGRHLALINAIHTPGAAGHEDQ